MIYVLKRKLTTIIGNNRVILLSTIHVKRTEKENRNQLYKRGAMKIYPRRKVTSSWGKLLLSTQRHVN